MLGWVWTAGPKGVGLLRGISVWLHFMLAWQIAVHQAAQGRATSEPWAAGTRIRISGTFCSTVARYFLRVALSRFA